ncbi:hypothetical protein V5O48_014989, partial [Marasmius crinis-equi]
EYESLHGRDGFNRNYKFRDVRPRELLELDKGSQDYKESVERWRKEKAERYQAWKDAR